MFSPEPSLQPLPSALIRTRVTGLLTQLKPEVEKRSAPWFEWQWFLLVVSPTSLRRQTVSLGLRDRALEKHRGTGSQCWVAQCRLSVLQMSPLWPREVECFDRRHKTEMASSYGSNDIFAFLPALFCVWVMRRRGNNWLHKSDFYLSSLAAKEYIAGLKIFLIHSIYIY